MLFFLLNDIDIYSCKQILINCGGYLPNRQLRNNILFSVTEFAGYLPNRQLRNTLKISQTLYMSYLPNRQLRNKRK
jgi:hypothetical protein